ncbi:hypothetical protein [Calidifontibacillus oryziterrae]|uniref:hypothetical protein n=1 Tax=Calidifontibacillus oryziterrae TaxID=1191699 RepID=UPI0003074EE3|nr:hypothetical protein [Calidifontibacillus oryziterrae]
MGVLPCACSATVDASGSQTIPIGPINVTLNFDVDINICPDCTLDNSFVNASFSANIPIIGEVTASFEGEPVGFPVCFEDNGDQILEVDVEGNLIINGGGPDLVSFTLTLNSSGQVCINLQIGPIMLPCLSIPVEITAC